MRCPRCKHYVDPFTEGRWFSLIDKENLTVDDILLAVRKWDEETMECGGQSTLPTELRDCIRNVTNKK